MKKTAIILLGTILLFSACKKEKDIEPCSCPAPASTFSDMYHFPLTIGSYWIYEYVVMDSSYNVTSVMSTDSIYITGDTTINGKQYAVKKYFSSGGTSSGFFYPLIQRDSAGYLVDPSGNYIRHDDFTSILNSYTSISPPYSMISRMAHKDSVVTLPAGSFPTVDYEQHVTILDPPYTGNRNKYNHTIMADGIGVAYKSACFYYSPGMTGIRLLRYHIAP